MITRKFIRDKIDALIDKRKHKARDNPWWDAGKVKLNNEFIANLNGLKSELTSVNAGK